MQLKLGWVMLMRGFMVGGIRWFFSGLKPPVPNMPIFENEDSKYGIGGFSPEQEKPKSYGEAKAVGSVFAICIFGIGVFTAEQFSLKKLNALALSFSFAIFQDLIP